MTNLTDAEIFSEMKAGRLILGAGDQRPSGACYELSMGDVYFDLTEGNKKFEIPKDGATILIKPGHRVVLFTQEEVDVPHNLVGRIVNKGSLFTVGLTPVATYADPGFKGPLGIVTQNISDRYIELQPRDKIAKIDFTRLSRNVDSIHRDQSFQSKLQTPQERFHRTHKQVAPDPRVGSPKDEAYAILPHAVADILRDMERRNRSIDIVLMIIVLFNTVVLAAAATKFIDQIVGFGLNLLASLVAAIVAFFVRGRSGMKHE